MSVLPECLVAVSSATQRHDRVDDIIPILLERFDGLLSRHAGLVHDEVDILALQIRVVDFIVIIVVVLGFLGLLFALAVVVVVVIMPGVVVAGVVSCAGVLGSGELLGGAGLGLRVEVFDLGFSEDAASCVRTCSW